MLRDVTVLPFFFVLIVSLTVFFQICDAEWADERREWAKLESISIKLEAFHYAVCWLFINTEKAAELAAYTGRSIKSLDRSVSPSCVIEDSEFSVGKETIERGDWIRREHSKICSYLMKLSLGHVAKVSVMQIIFLLNPNMISQRNKPAKEDKKGLNNNKFM